MFGFGRRHGRHEMNEGGDRHDWHARMHRDDGFGPRGGPHFAAHDHGGHERGGRGPEGRGPFGRGGRGGGGPFGGRGRFFDHGDLKLVILALVAEKPSHGYEIIKAIEERVGGAYSPSPGVVYPTLTMLEDLGYVTVETVAGNRKQHQITEAGQAYLAANAAEVKLIMARMAAASEHMGGARSPQLMRAMENLKMAMRLKLEGGGLNQEQITTITAALDEAAGKIERC